MLPKAPETPLQAVTHPHPYPYYAGLVRERPLYLDAALGLWVASGAEAVTAVLESAACRVRPAAAPVPEALRGSASGFLFERLVRMTDGPAHPPLKRALSLSLQSLHSREVGLLSRACAQRLAAQTLEPLTREGLEAFVSSLSVHVLSSLLGLPSSCFEAVRRAVEAYLVGLLPSASPACRQRGSEGAEVLLELVKEARASQGDGGLLARFWHEASAEEDVLLANAAGLLTQAYEATSGLIGNTLLALGSRPEWAEGLRRAPAGLEATLAEVLRYDAPVQNTRRFVARDVALCGERLAQGDTVLVVLAAANRDPEANPEPDAFQPSRRCRRTFTFGAGGHLCPGQALALAIAQAALERLLLLGLDWSACQAVGYRPSANVRVPRFA
jgi:cytochrome P450